MMAVLPEPTGRHADAVIFLRIPFQKEGVEDLSGTDSGSTANNRALDVAAARMSVARQPIGHLFQRRPRMAVRHMASKIPASGCRARAACRYG